MYASELNILHYNTLVQMYHSIAYYDYCHSKTDVAYFFVHLIHFY